MDPDPGQSPLCHDGEPGAADGGRLQVDIVRRDRAWPHDRDEEALILAAARAAFAAAAQRPWDTEVCILLTDDDEMRGLNRDWRGQDKSTNVLSFPLDMPRHGPARALGDVVLAFQTVAREAEVQGVPRAWHAAHLAVHGLLHLLGHAHDGEREAAAMEALEARILTRLGLHDPYPADDEGPRGTPAAGEPLRVGR